MDSLAYTKMRIWVIILLMFLTGCDWLGKSGKGIVNVETPKISPTFREVGMDVMKDIKDSTITGMEIPSITGIVISTNNFTVSTKILDKFNSPLLKTYELNIFKSENIPKGVKVLKDHKYYDKGKLEKHDVEIYEPIEKGKSPIMDYVLVGLMVILIIIVLKKKGG